TADGYAEGWDLAKLWDALKTLYPVGLDYHNLIDSDEVGEPGELTQDELREALIADAEKAYAKREADLEAIAGPGAMRQLERSVLLNVIDRKWREHLYEMDYLKEGIGLRAMAQRDPLVEYQREGFDMFTGMLEGLKEESVGFLFNVQVEAQQAPQVAPVAAPQGLAQFAAEAEQNAAAEPAAPAALRAKGIEEKAPAMTYSGPAEDGSAEVRREGGRHAAGPGSRRERREAARKQKRR
ncbi:MAG: preprotein translocase subunit SecA, partial [Actinobacteria bacterium]|nr:preprotein translocase subunit SecA [Actinomycetota bacterium]